MILKKVIFRDDYILQIYKIVNRIDHELDHLNLDLARKYQQLGVLGVFNSEVALLDSQVENVAGKPFLKKMKKHPTVKQAFRECHFKLVKLTRNWNYFLQKKVMYQDVEYFVYDMIFMNITEEEFREYVLGKKSGLRNAFIACKEFLKGLKNDFQMPISIEKEYFREPSMKECLEQWNSEDENEENIDLVNPQETLSYERKKTS